MKEIEGIKQHLWDVNHPYYCNEGNYFASGSDCHCHYQRWQDFIAEQGDSDLDMNLLFQRRRRVIYHPAILNSKPKRNVFEEITAVGHDEDYTPHSQCEPTEHAAGSIGKIEAMVERLRLGQALHHVDDNRNHCTTEQESAAATYCAEQMRIYKLECREKRRLEELSRKRQVETIEARKVVTHKLCPRCKEQLPVDMFRVCGNTTWDGRDSYCGPCRRAYRRAAYLKKG